MFPKSVDVTGITGAQVVGPPVSWQTPNGPFNVEHLAAVNAANELLAFWWSPQHDWQVVNATAKTGQPVIGGIAAWQTPNGPFLVEHLAARSPDGDLIVFWWSPQHDWQAVNVSAKTGRRVAGAPVSWLTSDGARTVEHLAARGPNNELLVFWWSPAHDWQVVDVTAKTVDPSLDPTRGFHATARWSSSIWAPLAGRNAFGVLVVAGARLAGGQRLCDRGRYRAGRTVSWLAGSVEHVAVRGSQDELFVYWWTPATNWRRVDVTAITGIPIEEVSGVYQLGKSARTPRFSSARGVHDSLLRFWWRPSRDWQAQNLSHATGVDTTVGPRHGRRQTARRSSSTPRWSPPSSRWLSSTTTGRAGG